MPLNPTAKPFSDLSAGAEPFVPPVTVAPKPTVLKSGQYRGDSPEYFEEIKGRLLEYNWQVWVKTIYVKNGWHMGNENGMRVVLCDYRLNDDSDAIQPYHWYPQLGVPPGTC